MGYRCPLPDHPVYTISNYYFRTHCSIVSKTINQKPENMKILHTSDWHLGKRLERFSRMEEQKEVMDEICSIADRENVDAVIIAGDLFDTFNPSAEAAELLYKTLKKMGDNGQRAVIAIAGNHDSPDRVEAPDPLARECGILFAGYPHSKIPLFKLESGLAVTRSAPGFVELNLPRCKEPLRLIFTPYANEYRMKACLGFENTEEELRQQLQQHWEKIARTYCDAAGVNVLCTHLFLCPEGTLDLQEPEDEKPILYVGGAQPVYPSNLPEQIHYCALGHLHRCQTVASAPFPVVYSGTPLSYSFAESGQKKYVVLMSLETKQAAKIAQIELQSGKKLLRKKCYGVDQALSFLRENPFSDSLIELTLITDDYLSAAQRRSLNECHEGIVSIIPEVKNGAMNDGAQGRQIDLTKSMNDLFVDYFRSKKGQTPSEDILAVFNEICAATEES